jgi:hypothetical protein
MEARTLHLLVLKCYGVVLTLGAKPTREHRLCIADLHSGYLRLAQNDLQALARQDRLNYYSHGSWGSWGFWGS